MSERGIVAQAADRVEAWFEAAWPLWLERGQDRQGLFHEQLDQDGWPDLASPRRVRVQARQLYTASRALAAGHQAARPMLARGLAAIDAHCRDEAGGWVHLLEPDGAVRDRLRDCYDQAFMLFGLCGAAASGLAGARGLADLTLAFAEAALSDPRDGSLREGVPPSLPRRSNPHMHWLEAMLAWHALTGEPAFLERADRIAGLFLQHFYDPATGTLGEFFTDTLQPAPSPEGRVVEPGHQFEWSWLLHQLDRAGGMRLRNEAAGLHRWGLDHGCGAAGFAIDECDRSGRQVRRSRRLWPQTELIKSHLANDAPDAAAKVAMMVLDTYLATPVAGLWIDRFDADGRPDAAMVPASTLYHLVVAFEALLRAAGRRVG